MSTIALYKNKLIQMPGLIKEVKNTVTDYKKELFSLNSKTLSINKSICNVDDIIGSIQTSSQTQEEKCNALDTFVRNNTQFVSDAVRIDSEAADAVKQRKDDFYNKYQYLKPECEKSWMEKAGEWMSSAGEWCKEHWVMLVTIVAVIVVAAIAVVCGVAVAFIAAVAGVIALVLFIADVVCMLATGGKGIADVLRENGYSALADVFQGISVGADIVSILFPVGAAIKTMTKVGIRTFVRGSIDAAKMAFKETIEKVFKSGFKEGIKNAGKILFKTFIIDLDDFKSWKAESLLGDAYKPNKHWIVDGDQLIPNSNSIPGKRVNKDQISMADIIKKYGYDSVPLKDGFPDLGSMSVESVDISMKNLDPNVIQKVLNGEMSDKKFSQVLRKINFDNAGKALDLKVGMKKSELEKTLGYKLTWHEDISTKKCYLIPREIHGNIKHIGGIGNYKFNFSQIPDIAKQISTNISQFGFRGTSMWGMGKFSTE